MAAVFAGLGIAAVVFGAWYFAIRDDGAFHFVIPNTGPPPVSLAAALEAVGAIPGADLATEGDLSGTWVVVRGENSFAGYRVRETLATFGAHTAVGRTGEVEGRLEFDGTAITSVEATVDLTTLTSDQGERDEALGDQALETDTFPTATFALTSPVPVGNVPSAGEAVSQTVKGALTLHGVTREIALDAEGALQSGLLVVVASAEIAFADFGIERPVSFSVLSIEDHGTLELQLVFEHAGGP